VADASAALVQLSVDKTNAADLSIGVFSFNERCLNEKVQNSKTGSDVTKEALNCAASL